MEKTQKIIIVALIAILIALSGVIAFGMMHEQTKTVELFKNGTTMEVPLDTNLTNQTEFSTTYTTGKNTIITAMDKNSLAGALASKILSDLIVENGEMQDNGLYKLDKKSVMELNDQIGNDYDEKDIHEVSIGLKHNNTVNQTVIIAGVDEKEITDMLNSIQWKKGAQSDIINATKAESSTPTSDTDKTYPFYADDGSVVGYYHVGDVVEHYDGLYQLKSNGEWVYIGEAQGSSENAYNQGYSDAIDDTLEDYDDYDYSESSSSDNIETTADE